MKTIQQSAVRAYPVLKSYAGQSLLRVSLPIGGIGTGTVGLGGRGNLQDWELANTPAKGLVPLTGLNTGGSQTHAAFFALRVRQGDAPPKAMCLEGPIPHELYEGAFGCPMPNAGLPRFDSVRFDTAYPLATLTFEHEDMPLGVKLAAMNPLVPGDVSASDLPVAVLRYELTNPTDQDIDATVCGCIPNYIGCGPGDYRRGFAGITNYQGGQGNINRFDSGNDIVGLRMEGPEVDTDDPNWGTMALTTLADDDWRISHQTQWNHRGWAGAVLDFWEHLAEHGEIADQPGAGQKARPMASLAGRATIPAGQTRTVTFLLTWHFPNRQTWTPKDDGQPNTIGNHYTTRFADAWDAAEHVATNLPSLEQRTVDFVDAFCASDVPEAIREAALFNVSTLRTQTCFRTPDGRFYGWEGCGPDTGCCHGSCTHVWNYENTLAFLFGDLSRTMRDNEFGEATDEQGAMSFRVSLPLGAGRNNGKAAADGQMGAIVRMYRDWQLSGDSDWLKGHWPVVRKAMEFCWEPGGWDPDRDGVMEGCQHNTMDVEYYGPNPQMTGWYLAALLACKAMATHMGEDEFAATCGTLFESGKAKMHQRLFNGEYFEHIIEPLDQGVVSLPQVTVGMGAASDKEPDFQLGPGCLVDQLVGQYMAHAVGLGYVQDPASVVTTLASILKYNRRTGFGNHFNNMRSYVLGDETALLMTSYPRGNRPKYPMPYHSEVMTGFEYTVASGLIYEGRFEQGLQVVRDIRARYDGAKRNPFNEAECGNHYARAMAAWTSLLAWTGFVYSAVTGTMRFRVSDRPVTWFWSTGAAFGAMTQTPDDAGSAVTIRIIEGDIDIQQVELVGDGGAGPVSNLTIERA